MHDIHYKRYVTTNGTTLPGPSALKKRKDRYGRNYNINVPRPAIIAKYQQETGWVDRHNRFRQGILHLPNIWTTRRWQTRIQLEILAQTLVDSFLACQNIMPRWQDEGDVESLFWKFVATLIPQIDPRGKDELGHELEEDAECASRCHIVRLGQKIHMTANIAAKRELFKCVVPIVPCKTNERRRLAVLHLLHGLVLFITKLMLAKTKIAGRTIWLRSAV
jgi:hypothetical protein